MAAMRPPMTAGPIERARSPPNVAGSIFTASSASAGTASAAMSARILIVRKLVSLGVRGAPTSSLLLLRLFRHRLLRLGHVERRGVDGGGIQLDLLDGDGLRPFMPLGVAV